jgi:hypothetical protein
MQDDQATPDDSDEEQIRQEENLNMLSSKLNRLAQEQVAARRMIETRWLADLRQYHGEYTPDETKRMSDNNSSQVFVNITRNKTRAGIARMSDMLLPNDDTNFGVKSTPVPAMSATNGAPMQADMQQQGQGMVDGMPESHQSMDPETHAKAMQAMEQGAPGENPGSQSPQAKTNEAKKQADEAARQMQQQIEDDFAEANYNAHARDVIEDACKLGTGVLKGPKVVNRTRRAWITDPQTGKSEIEVQDELRAGLERVDPWDAFPDMSAASAEEAEFWFERKLLNRKQLRELADLPGVIEGQLRRALESDGSHYISNDRRQELRAITGVDTVTNSKKYELWEYWGPLDKDELKACGCEDIDDDVLVEYTGCVLMVGGHVIKAAINPLESGDLPYSVFNWEQDDSSIFGFGIPYLMRQPQKVVNASWRMMMDNAVVSAGPQIVMKKRGVVPQDGNWAIRPNKVWLDTGDEPVGSVFQVYQIENNQGGLFAIFEAAQKLADTETNLPILLQGEGMSAGAGGKTFGGMQMLMNNSNIVLRSAVKNFDDGVTAPTVRRFYDYHMMYTDRPEIKGDFDIVARGTSVLIAREEQQEKLMMLSQVAAQNPIFAKLTNWAGLYREILRAMQVQVDTVTYTDEEIKTREAEEGEGPSVEEKMAMFEMKLKQEEHEFAGKRLEAELDHKEWEREYKAAQLQSEQEHQRAGLALKEGITMAELEAKVGLESQSLEVQMRQTAAKIQADRDQKAAELSERQNDRLARQENMSNGYDSYG